jgi:cell division protein FtsL
MPPKKIPSKESVKETQVVSTVSRPLVTMIGQSDGDTAKKVEQISWVMNVLVIALFIGFTSVFIAAVGIFSDAYYNKAATYQSLRDQISVQSNKIDNLEKTINSLFSTPSALLTK